MASEIDARGGAAADRDGLAGVRVQRRPGARPLRGAPGGRARLVAPVPGADVRAAGGAPALAVRGGGALPPLRHARRPGRSTRRCRGRSPAGAREGLRAGGGEQLGPPPPRPARRSAWRLSFDTIVYSGEGRGREARPPDLPPGARASSASSRARRSTSATAGWRTSRGPSPPAMHALHLAANTGGGDLRDLARLPDLAGGRAGRAGADRRWAAGVLD